MSRTLLDPSELPTLNAVLRHRAAEEPDRLAYTFLLDGEAAEARITYAELDLRARAVAARLAELGARGERVLLLFPAGLDYVASFLGCLYAGAVAVPAYPPRPNRPMPRIRAIVADAGAAVALTTAEILATLERRVRELPDLAALTWQAVDGGEGPGADAWSDPGVAPETLAFLQYTSGSTAAPKGVMVSHGNLMHNEELIRRACGHGPDTPCVSWLPLYHDLGLIGNMLQSLYVGAPCVLMAPVAFLQRPRRWLEAVSRYRAHTSGGPNFAYDLCVDKIGEDERRGLDLSCWRVAFNGAEPVRAETLSRFARAFAPAGFSRGAAFPCYGLAETTLIVSGGGRDEPPVATPFVAEELSRGRAVPAPTGGAGSRALVGCGHPLGGLEVAIVDPESRVPEPEGGIGEIWVAGPSVARGYWNRPEQTAETFGAETADGRGPFLRTGDLGFLWQGELYVAGRAKDLIIIRGMNHYPQDLERSAEASHPALRPGASAAFSVDDGGGERLVLAAEVHREHRRAEPEAVAAAVRRALLDEHELDLWALALLRPGSIPKTTSGKIQRRLARERLLAGELPVVGEWRRGAGAAPREEPGPPESLEALESWLAARLAEVAGVAAAEIAPGTCVAGLGLDSLRAVELLHAVEQATGVALDLARLYDGPPVAELAREIWEARDAAGGGGEDGAAAAGAGAPADVSGEHPLSHGQEALWFLHRLEPTSAAYHLTGAVRVLSKLDVRALQGAFQTLVDRHPALRTTFGLSAGRPVQRVAAAAEVDFRTLDASGWSGDELAAHLSREAERPFDLESEPPLRVRLFTRVGAPNALLVTLHHIAGDFWSLAVLLRELGELYTAAVEGREARLAEAAPYAELVGAQRRMLAGPEGAALRDYWHRELAGELPVLELPTDRPRPPVQTYRGAAESLRLEPELARELRSLAREHRTTLFAVLLAAFQVLLGRYAGQTEVLVGTPAAGRRRARTAGAVGYFVNPVVLRADMADNPGFGAFLGQARRRVLGAFEHQDYPFPLLVADLQPVRDPSRSPLFQVMFALQAAPSRHDADLTAFAVGQAGAEVRLGALRLAHLPLPQRIAQFDLTLSAAETAGVEGTVAATLDYNLDLFDPVTAGRLSRDLQVLLAAAVRAPGRRVLELPLLTREERRQLVVERNRTWTRYPREATLDVLFAARAAQVPDAVAAVHADAHLSYGKLNRCANRLAHRLGRLGVGTDDRVALYAERSPVLMAGLLGVLKAGAAYVPLEPASPPERLAFMVQGSQARAVVAQPGPGPGWPPGVEVVPLGAGMAAGEPEVDPPSRAHPESAACLIYTSGSTGAPKGVVLEHRGLVNLVFSFLRSYNAGRADAVLPLTSVAFASFTGEVLPLLCCGGRVVLPRQEELLDPAETADLIARQAVSIVSAVPSVIAALNAAADALPELRLILSGGEALAGGDVDRLLGRAAVVNGYGLTETTICSTVYALSQADFVANLEIPIGRPVANHRVYCLGPGLELVPVGAVGELFIAGEGLARGLFHHPAATAARFLPDPFGEGERMYRTGDLARWRNDGHLVFTGRIDHQVKLRGYRIELGEIESILSRHPAVRETAVALRSDPSGAGGEGREGRLVAYCVFHGETAPPVGELASWVRRGLPEYMVPSTFVALPALPVTPNGKLDLRALPAPPAQATDFKSAYAAPRGELERAISGVWSEVLGLPRVGIHDNFFDLGGHSLLVARVHGRLREVLGEAAAGLSLVDLFRFPTVEALVAHLGRGAEKRAPRVAEAAAAVPAAPQRDIAVVGMAGRFPGARNVDELWANLVAGVESISRFSDDELLAEGTDPALVADPNYVKARGILGEVDLFDAAFFGIDPRSAELTDPQHRVFLECAWEALETAGYDPDRYGGRIGVFAGQSMNTYWLNNLYHHIDLVASVDSLRAAIGNDKDSLTTEVSYRMDLRGPSVLVQSSSSTSLTAVHYACQSLLAGECDMALAGGVSIHLPEKAGYLYHEGGTTDPEGHCRTFDARAQGFVSGHGAGVVVLKRLDAARAAGDRVLAVIKGSACNNDGSGKVSYMAPSVDGHAQVVAAAQAAAGVSPDSVTYVEAHGTATLLGDPIEVAALTQAFRQGTERRGYCALGSVKPNIGHLDTAAGVAGLIKAVLCLQHRTLPPVLHFETPNPKIDFASSPFFVSDRLREWEAAGGPRRAGVSSLGMGGTNTHAVLEEAPAAETSGPSRPWQLLLQSARTGTALDAATLRLASHLEGAPGAPLADVAYTLGVGRRCFAYRRAAVCRDPEDAARALTTLDPERVVTGFWEEGAPSVVFLLSGQGSQYPGMGRDLYESEPAFRREVDRSAEILLPLLGRDVRWLIFPPVGDAETEAAAADELALTSVTQPALFTVEYALARLWMSWGVLPRALLGHSIGEVVAACLAGVMSLPDALGLVVERGRLMGAMPPGSMLAVPLPEREVRRRLPADLDFASVNRPDMCVVAGPEEEVAAFARELAGEGLEPRTLRTSHAFHSRMMDPVLAPFTAAVARVPLAPPRLPFVSNLTGTWITPAQATDPGYWARQIRSPVRFADGVGELLAGPDRVLLEVGPGNTLATAARNHPAAAAARERGEARVILSSLRHPREERDDLAFLLSTLGRLWLTGVEVDTGGFWAGERRKRVPLPTYPFERRRFWVEPGRPGEEGRRRVSTDPGDWLYAPVWKQRPRPRAGDLGGQVAGRWLVLADGASEGPGARLGRRLRELGARVTTVLAADRFGTIGPERYQVSPLRVEDYEALVEELAEDGEGLWRVVHLWSLDPAADAGLPQMLERGHESLLALARALGAAGREAVIAAVTNGLADVTGGEELQPARATLLGACAAVPQEYAGLSCRVVDAGAALGGELVDRVLAEVAAAAADPPDGLVALRGPHRWVRGFEALEPAAGPSPLRERGVYLITGGLGGLGLEVAAHLAREHRARLVLVGRRGLPSRERWEDVLSGDGGDEALRSRIRRVLDLEELGGEVLVASADVTDRAAMEEVKVRAVERFGPIAGAFHAAGVPGGALVATRSREQGRRVLAPKVQGTLVLAEALRDQPLDFLVLFSSTTSLLSQLGQADYAAANAFLDAYAWAASREAGPMVTAVNWDAWREVGMAVETEVPAELAAFRRESLALGLSPQQGVEALRRVLAAGLPQVVVSRQPFAERVNASFLSRAVDLLEAVGDGRATHLRPDLSSPYLAPRNEVEKRIAAAWEEILGLAQVGVHDNFFELGGNSLVGLKVIARVKAEMGVELSAAALFEGPTVAAMAGVVERERGGGEAEPVRPAIDDRRSRGARRRERLRRRQA